MTGKGEKKIAAKLKSADKKPSSNFYTKKNKQSE
jgi:hypothetical protein